MLNPGIVSQQGGGNPPVTPLLDLYPGAIGAYSFRKLSSSYTGYCIQVFRQSDSAIQDIGFTGNGELNTNALAQFASGDFAYIKTWYDQSGNNNDLIGNGIVPADFGLIYTANNVYKVNGKPALFIQFSQSTSNYSNPTLSLNTDSLSIYSTIRVVDGQAISGYTGVVGTYGVNDDYRTFNLFADGSSYFGDNVTFHSMNLGVVIFPNNYGAIIGTVARSSTDREVFNNGFSSNTNTNNSSYSFSPIVPSNYRAISGYSSSGINEIIMYPTGHSSATAIGIQNNMGQYYTIT